MAKPGPYVRFPAVVTILVLCGVEYGLLGLAFELSAVERAVMAALTFACLLLSARRGVYPFCIVLLVGVTVFIALTCGLGSQYRGDSPLRLNVVLGPWLIFLLAAVLAGAALWIYEREPVPRRFPAILAVAFAVDWVLLSVNVAHFQDWLLENVLTVPFALLIVLTHKWFRLSNISYGLIFVYMVLHIIGTHYTYSEVPFGFWLQDVLEASRNHYDRIVHFSFGLLMAYPMREVGHPHRQLARLLGALRAGGVRAGLQCHLRDHRMAHRRGLWRRPGHRLPRHAGRPVGRHQRHGPRRPGVGHRHDRRSGGAADAQPWTFLAGIPRESQGETARCLRRRGDRSNAQGRLSHGANGGRVARHGRAQKCLLEVGKMNDTFVDSRFFVSMLIF